MNDHIDEDTASPIELIAYWGTVICTTLFSFFVVCGVAGWAVGKYF